MNRKFGIRALCCCVVFLLAVPPTPRGQQSGEAPVFKPEELDQLLAPIALYPDSLVSQILMASTYPLEVVQADRWAKENQGLKGDALTAALEKQTWDPSVKSLVNFPEVLTMMGDKLDWTQKLGDAFLGQQKDVLATVQDLRAKAEAAGNLETTKEQKVIVEKETKTIIIEPANPEVIYVPTYNPTVVYGASPYPAYPPYCYYPPGYVATASLFSFAAGVALGSAWGYAWGSPNWSSGKVKINVDQNININKNINRANYKQQWQGKGQIDRTGKGDWQHDASHRKGVAYRDQTTAQKFNRGTSAEAAKSREAFRGRAEQGRQQLARGGSQQPPRGQGPRQAGDRSASRQGQSSLGGSRSGGKQSPERGGAFQGIDRGSNVRTASQRGKSSRHSASTHRSAGKRAGARSGGGGRKSGGGRRR